MSLIIGTARRRWLAIAGIVVGLAFIDWIVEGPGAVAAAVVECAAVTLAYSWVRRSGRWAALMARLGRLDPHPFRLQAAIVVAASILMGAFAAGGDPHNPLGWPFLLVAQWGLAVTVDVESRR